MVDIPFGLRQALEAGNCVLFLGAGVGRHLSMADGSHAPDARTLAGQLAAEFKVVVGDAPDLAKIAQIVELRKGRPELEAYLKTRLCGFEPDEAFGWITTIPWRAIFTTNYDNGIEQIYAQATTPPQTPIPVTSASELKTFDRRIQVPVYYLHGKLCGSENPHILITENDYAKFSKQRQMMFALLKLEFATSTFLYIGYSNQDPNWKIVFEELKSEFYPSSLPLSYRVSLNTDPLDEEILKSKNIETITASFDDFQKSASLALANSGVNPDLLKRIESTVPPDLIPAFENNPAAVVRLLNSWEYVNQTPFSGIPNTSDFFRGDKGNWALIAKKIHFERDLEDELYEALLDYATASSNKPGTSLVLAPAGYGTTTLLRTIAARWAQDRNGPVFIHREGMPLMQGDIAFATSFFGDLCPFFIIDNAADYEGTIGASLQYLRDRDMRALFLLGEHLNEWRSVHQGKQWGHEFVIEPLSDQEINRLLHSLEVNQELNQLEHLSPELRFAAIKKNYLQELLVTLREATEDRRFDAILEGEFRNIPSDTGKRLYLATACFYQHGALARDTLISDLLGISLTTMYSETKHATEGIVIFDLIDPSYGHYAARTRHRKIAAIVWERCSTPGEKEELLIAALSRMNLNYTTDVKAFEDFIRSERIVDEIRTLEGRINFFDQACQKEPNSPYVRQHYARMLARSGKFILALGQIEEGLKLNPNIKVLHHTKGTILAQMAMNTDSREIARRKLVQSEDEFRRCLSMSKRDEYAYQSLATLYVDWAKRSDDPAETTEYLAKAEAVIDEGLRAVRVRDGLWIVSAQIQDFLGHKPEFMEALSKAANSATSSIVAKYLLGRAHRQAGDYPAAIKILKSVVETHPEEYRVCIEYALSLEAAGESYSACIAVLKLGNLYGLGDPRFVGTLGGMLFMNKDFSSAKDTFNEAYRREFPAPEAIRVQYRPLNPKHPMEPLQLTGVVKAVKTGYAFIEASGYSDFFCPASKFGLVVMSKDLKVQFEPVFTARGATANKVKLSGT